MRRSKASIAFVACCVCVFAVVCAFVCAPSAWARRAPSPGDSATLALPLDLHPRLVEAHVHAPLLVSSADDGLPAGRTVIGGDARFASSVIQGVSRDDDGKRWRVRAGAHTAIVAESIEACLQGRFASWPAQVLRAAGVTVAVTVSQEAVLLAFSSAVGPVAELLSGCLARKGDSPTGPYALAGPGMLAWRSGGLDAPPLLNKIDLKPLGDRASLTLGGADARQDGAILLAPFPDVVLLLQTPGVRQRDPLGLTDARTGPRGFRTALRADLLAAAYAQGRGAPTEAILPPGVAPARPLPPVEGGEQTPLALTQLPAGAPRLPVRRALGDPLLDALAERLAVLLRARGFLLEVKKTSSDSTEEGLSLVRWRPPTTDAALALLFLAGQQPELLDDPGVKKALSDRRLLSPDPAARLAAALDAERAFIASGFVVPLLSVDRWFIVDPDLRGVVVRPDGIPLLDGAWWAGAR